MKDGAQPNPRPASFDPWRLVIESVRDYAIFVLDPDGRVMTWNPGAEAIKGYSADEIVGQHFSKFYPASDIEAGKPDLELAIAQRDGRVEDEGWRLRKDGSRFWANVVITALREPNGELYGFAKVTRDLSMRQEVEETLRRSEERFRVLVESVDDYAIYMLDPAGRITTWNRGAENLKGYKAAEVLGKSIRTFFTEEDQRAGKPERELETAKGEGRFEEEGFRVRKDGSRFWANVVVTPIYDGQGRHMGFAKVTRDLTARLAAQQTELDLAREQAARTAAEQAEIVVREAAEAAVQANRVKDEFLATVSHELRTPLSAILGWASVLNTVELEPSVQRAVSAIQRNALAQKKIIEDILDVSRIITGKLHLDLRPLDLVAIMREAVEVIRPSLSAKQMSLDFASDSPHCIVLGDSDRLLQIAWNLLSNAVKFSKQGGGITVSVRRQAGMVDVSVVDTGSGIDPEFLPSVFDRFMQADSSSTRRHGGLGLGLAIVRHLVELHGGEVEALSAGLGQGATFTFSLPLRPSQGQGESVKSRGTDLYAAMAEGALHALRVVVVDDEEDSRELACIVLARAGAEVRTASSASEAFAAVRAFKPHVLVSDIAMPDEDGYSLLRRVMALDALEGGGIPAVALTAYASESDRAKALATGFRAHIAKPLQPDALVTAVANVLPNTRPPAGDLGTR
jgi:PAS domain S-box-containing protein